MRSGSSTTSTDKQGMGMPITPPMAARLDPTHTGMGSTLSTSNTGKSMSNPDFPHIKFPVSKFWCFCIVNNITSIEGQMEKNDIITSIEVTPKKPRNNLMSSSNGQVSDKISGKTRAILRDLTTLSTLWGKIWRNRGNSKSNLLIYYFTNRQYQKQYEEYKRDGKFKDPREEFYEYYRKHNVPVRDFMMIFSQQESSSWGLSATLS